MGIVAAFSIFVFSAGIIIVYLSSKEFKKMINHKYRGEKEAGPRAYLINKLEEVINDESMDDEQKRKEVDHWMNQKPDKKN
ncbi:MAG: hypothetical protein LAT68_11645 [Cyclobacteriaceae bacterium]|nr:hypothetical protein [Cyclobacteriaceae bacterium]MCH8516970.1 hypothetical protein [Cyclobacteriaceae bacterium]